MKKKFIIIVLLLCLAVLFFLFFNKKEKNNNVSYDENAWKKYAEKIGTYQTEDGWIYYFLINTLNNGKTTQNFYQGCSLKYSELDEYGITYEDGDTFTIKSYPTLAVSNKSKNGIKEKDEILTIDNYFNDKNFKREITEKDLDTLNLNNFSKKQVVKMYNLAYNDSFTKDNFKLQGAKECYIISDLNKDGYKINIGYLFQKRGIMALRIDLLYEDGTYLIDMINNGMASDNQIKLYNNFKKIEKDIIKNQNFDSIKNYDGDIYERIYKGFLEEFK